MGSRIKLIALLLLSILCASCNRDGPLLLEKPIEEVSEKLHQITPPLMEKNDVVGLSLGLIRNNKLVLVKSFGYADLDKKREINRETIFKAASLGKPVFAYVVLELSKQGIIDLDQPLYKYDGSLLIEDDPRSKKVTARMVLTHTTGVPNYGKEPKPKFRGNPGEKFEYSGYGFIYLQQIIESLTNKGLDQLASELVFNPLGMDSSSFSWRESYEGVISSSYQLDKEKHKVKKEWRKPRAAWSLYTTLDDYSKFIIYTLNTSTSSASITALATQSEVKVAKGVEWGLGWGLQATEPNMSFWHWGSMEGFRNYVVGYPEEQMAVIVFANSRKSFKIVDTIMAKSLGGSYPSYDWF